MKDEKVEKGQEFDDWNSLPRHRDEDQVQLDVDRSFVYYPNSTIITVNKFSSYN